MQGVARGQKGVVQVAMAAACSKDGIECTCPPKSTKALQNYEFTNKVATDSPPAPLFRTARDLGLKITSDLTTLKSRKKTKKKKIKQKCKGNKYFTAFTAISLAGSNHQSI